MFNILITSNNPILLNILKTNILDALQDFSAKIIIKKSSISALNYLEKNDVQITIADINLYDINGIDFFYKLNAKNKITHKILVSDKHEDYIKVAAYDVGVDDIINHKITSVVLKKKITQIFNRLIKTNGKQIYYNSLIIDKSKFLISYKDQQYNLPKKQFLIYALLCEKPGEIFARDEIYSNVWRQEMPADNRTVDVHIRQIRKSIPKNNIKTFRGIGYKVEEIKRA
tara:strand:- start:404 stop:1087 length:684 start_codon:yes stop_codon:yes gene_type:complete